MMVFEILMNGNCVTIVNLIDVFVLIAGSHKMGFYYVRETSCELEVHRKRRYVLGFYVNF